MNKKNKIIIVLSTVLSIVIILGIVLFCFLKKQDSDLVKSLKLEIAQYNQKVQAAKKFYVDKLNTLPEKEEVLLSYESLSQDYQNLTSVLSLLDTQEIKSDLNSLNNQQLKSLASTVDQKKQSWDIFHQIQEKKFQKKYDAFLIKRQKTINDLTNSLNNSYYELTTLFEAIKKFSLNNSDYIFGTSEIVHQYQIDFSKQTSFLKNFNQSLSNISKANNSNLGHLLDMQKQLLTFNQTDVEQLNNTIKNQQLDYFQSLFYDYQIKIFNDTQCMVKSCNTLNISTVLISGTNVPCHDNKFNFFLAKENIYQSIKDNNVDYNLNISDFLSSFKKFELKNHLLVETIKDQLCSLISETDYLDKIELLNLSDFKELQNLGQKFVLLKNETSGVAVSHKKENASEINDHYLLCNLVDLYQNKLKFESDFRQCLKTNSPLINFMLLINWAQSIKIEDRIIKHSWWPELNDTFNYSNLNKMLKLWPNLTSEFEKFLNKSSDFKYFLSPYDSYAILDKNEVLNDVKQFMLNDISPEIKKYLASIPWSLYHFKDLEKQKKQSLLRAGHLKLADILKYLDFIESLDDYLIKINQITPNKITITVNHKKRTIHYPYQESLVNFNLSNITTDEQVNLLNNVIQWKKVDQEQEINNEYYSMYQNLLNSSIKNNDTESFIDYFKNYLVEEKKYPYLEEYDLLGSLNNQTVFFKNVKSELSKIKNKIS